jgi:hypothetical protein
MVQQLNQAGGRPQGPQTQMHFMKKRNQIALIATTLLLAACAACIPSLNPFYTSKDVAFEDRLLGEWQETAKPQDPEIWKFEKGDAKAYKLLVTEEKGKHGDFNAHLFKLKDHYFLDLIPTGCDYATNQADLVNASMFAGHLLAHVSQMEPSLSIAFFNFEWLQKQLTNNPSLLEHRREGDSFVLTASTRDLQRFVLKHLGPDELFDKPGELVRRTNSIAPGK